MAMAPPRLRRQVRKAPAAGGRSPRRRVRCRGKRCRSAAGRPSLRATAKPLGVGGGARVEEEEPVFLEHLEHRPSSPRRSAARAEPMWLLTPAAPGTACEGGAGFPLQLATGPSPGLQGARPGIGAAASLHRQVEQDLGARFAQAGAPPAGFRISKGRTAKVSGTPSASSESTEATLRPRSSITMAIRGAATARRRLARRRRFSRRRGGGGIAWRPPGAPAGLRRRTRRACGASCSTSSSGGKCGRGGGSTRRVPR